MEFGKYLVLGTAHIRCATAELLTQWSGLPPTDQPIAVASTPCGWFVPTRLADDRHLPEELPHILAFARLHGCSYVLLDSDGAELDALPTFPW